MLFHKNKCIVIAGCGPLELRWQSHYIRKAIKLWCWIRTGKASVTRRRSSGYEDGRGPNGSPGLKGSRD